MSHSDTFHSPKQSSTRAVCVCVCLLVRMCGCVYLFREGARTRERQRESESDYSLAYFHFHTSCSISAESRMVRGQYAFSSFDVLVSTQTKTLPHSVRADLCGLATVLHGDIGAELLATGHVEAFRCHPDLPECKKPAHPDIYESLKLHSLSTSLHVLSVALCILNKLSKDTQDILCQPFVGFPTSPVS